MDKKEIKKQYKMKALDMGIYRIQNMANGRVYLGRALDLVGMLNSERFRLRNGLHVNRELQKDFRELGEGRFEFSVLDRLEARPEPGRDPAQELKELEALWLEKLRPFAERGYHQPMA